MIPVFHKIQAVARMFGCDDGKVLHFIKSGQLVGTNIAEDSGGRPRWRIRQDHLEQFLQRRQSQPPAPVVKRQKPSGGLVRKYFVRPANVDQQLTEVTEHIGESIGLSVVSHIHGLIEADWDPIPEQRGRSAKKSLDFQIASDGVGFVQVENKGSSVDDNSVIDGRIKSHANKIVDKIKSLGELSKTGDDPFPASLRYGTIVAVDSRRDGNVRCWLKDPPVDEYLGGAQRFRILRRMEFLRDLIGFLSARSPLAAALNSRLALLAIMTDVFEGNRIPLRKGNGEQFDFYAMGSALASLFLYKSRVVGEDIGGTVVPYSQDAVLFVGFRGDLLTLAAGQDFDAIASFEFAPASRVATVQCVVSNGRVRSLNLPAALVEGMTKEESYSTFRLSGTLHFSAGGQVFGILPFKRAK